MSYTRKTDLVIYETTDYDQFLYITSNRPVTKNTNLEKEMLLRNKQKYHPIHVNPDMEVIDGQHRLEICKRHNLPVYYIVDNEASEDDIRLVQSAKSWRQKDFLHYYATKRVQEYMFIRDMLDTHVISITCFLRAFAKTKDYTKSVSQEFCNGEVYLHKSFDEIRAALEGFSLVRDVCRKYLGTDKFHRDFEVCILHVILMDGCDIQHFIDRIKKNPDKLKLAYEFNRLENIKDILINQIYNKALSKEKKLKWTSHFEKAA